MGIIFIFSGCSTDDGLDEKDECSYGKDNCFCDGSFIFKSPENLLDWAVKLKLKDVLVNNYILLEDPEIKSLLLKHGVTISPSWCIPNSPPVLYLYYYLRGKGSMILKSIEHVVKNFLETKKFESEVYVYEISYITDTNIYN